MRKNALVSAIVVFVSLLAAVVVSDARLHHPYINHHNHPCVKLCRARNCTYGFFPPFSVECQCVGCKPTRLVNGTVARMYIYSSIMEYINHYELSFRLTVFVRSLKFLLSDKLFTYCFLY